MPVVTVTVGEHLAQRTLLMQVADAVASALGLGDSDVIATLVPSSDAVVSGGEGPEHRWPIVSIHGADRGADAIAAACSAAERSVRDWGQRNDIVFEGVCTEGLLPRPIP
jgi:hypothetical protein